MGHIMSSISTSENRSALKDFIASISAIKGDLSNITAPPFVLATKSTVEFPQYWAENPSLFVAPAYESDPEKRALLVLKWFLGSLKSQQYAGRSEAEGVKKPLNAFLGELFLGHWDTEYGRTRLISEQVSHHPPVTATVLWNDEVGIRAEGYTRQSVTFSGSVSVKQIGHAILTLTKHDNEAYYIPLPDVKVKGILSGTLYPELSGSYKITSTSGFTSEIDFSGKSSLLSSSTTTNNNKNQFTAKLYRDHASSGPNSPIYTISGQWSFQFTIYSHHQHRDLETYSTDDPQRRQPITVPANPDPWETHRAWSAVTAALHRGDMSAAATAKGHLEQAQRDMRRDEKRRGLTWRPLFFRSVSEDPIAERLAGVDLRIPDTRGIWRVDWSQVDRDRPFHQHCTPFGWDDDPGTPTASLTQAEDVAGGGRQPEQEDDRTAHSTNGNPVIPTTLQIDHGDAHKIRGGRGPAGEDPDYPSETL